jgi:CheY-like chemotaxis protein
MNGKKILIIDDDKWIADSYRDSLANLKVNVRIAKNICDALELIDKDVPDLIIMEILLSGFSAFSLINELRSYADTMSIPIIFCSNFINEHIIKNAKYYGVCSLLDKSKVTPNILRSEIVKALHD